MITRRDVLLVPLSVLSTMATIPLVAAQQPKTATVTLIIEGMT